MESSDDKLPNILFEEFSSVNDEEEEGPEGGDAVAVERFCRLEFELESEEIPFGIPEQIQARGKDFLT